MRPTGTLTDREQDRLLDVRIACPDIARAYDLARCFHDLMTNRLGTLLPDWIDQAEQDAPTPMRSFAGFLRQDLAAVTAGLTLAWSSGKVEGNVNRVKTLDFPAVRAAWLSLARWPDSPDPQLLLHVAVDNEPPGPVANHLLRALLHEQALRHLAYPKVAVVPLHPVAHAETIADLDRRGLPAVRHDSQPGPPETPAPAALPAAPKPKRRWFQRP
ncbi:transposase [Kitasatospora sp. NRRL B-11411]|uniref:transposase n=1 Tax=Kitasatospora sp. NRRL B-11411 TaxID=1463822 RepID=UPI00068B6B24|nr:transposase [Kitasatospora sp. NRRL B-11411]